jgi:2-polyprenyl-3-methyl-5-hydroxy-6-metoxy-1,4-benzoquinol methylase
MSEQQLQNLREKIKSLATESIRQQNPSGWFETLYADAKGDTQLIPWAKNQAHPYLQNWLETASVKTEGKKALVNGCGLGDDAETLARFGYNVTAFDIAPTAIAWCKQRFPESDVTYVEGNLFALNPSWQKQFDLVYECRNIQALPPNVRSQVIQGVGSLVAPQGKLLMITRHRPNDTTPEGPPWALSDEELSQFQELGLTEIKRDRFSEGEETVIEHLRIEYRLI